MSETIDKQKEAIKKAVKPPAMYNVLFLNDDYTTFEFVMACLQHIFGKTEEQAYLITQQIHNAGKGVVGQYTKDIALTKQQMALDFAQSMEYPLQVIIEQA